MRRSTNYLSSSLRVRFAGRTRVGFEARHVRNWRRIGGIALFALLCGTTLQFAQSKGSVQGFVVEDKSNQALEGVEVVLVEFGRTSPARNARVGITDSQGFFRIEDVTPGRYTLLPRLARFVYSREARFQAPRPGEPIEISPDRLNVETTIHMVHEAVITGKVFDRSGKPFSSASVYLGRRAFTAEGIRIFGNLDSAYAQTQPAETDDLGGYRFYGVQPGSYFVKVVPPGIGILPSSYYPGVSDPDQAAEITVEPGDELDLRSMTVDRPASERVRLTYSDPDGKLSNKLIRIDSALMFSFPPPSVPGMGGYGEFVVSMMPGHHDVVIYASGSKNELYYGQVSLDVQTGGIDQKIEVMRGVRVTGSIVLNDLSGKRLNSEGIACSLFGDGSFASAQPGKPGCIGGEFSPGHYRLSMLGMPPDAFIVSAKSGDRDVLADGIWIDSNPEIHIVLASPGGVIRGVVRDSMGVPLSDAAVVLVPDSPLRSRDYLYRSATSDPHADFEITGVAPGAYHLFAWQELSGAAYKNEKFMRSYDGKGKAVSIETASHLTTDVIADE